MVKEQNMVESTFEVFKTQNKNIMKTRIAIIALIILASFNASAQQSFTTNTISVRTEGNEEFTTIHWSVSREVNSSYFLVQRSLDSQEYKTIHSQPAAGSTHAKTEYTFEDLTIDDSPSTYRIIMVLMDGTRIAGYQDIKSVSDLALDSE